MRPILMLAAACLATTPVYAAGNGAGAGGAGHQRTINSGLPPGEAGPLGSPNNPRPPKKPLDGTKDAPHGEGASTR